MSGGERWAEAVRWLRYAKEDLNTAEVLFRDDCISRHICWLAQHSVEKALKSIFVFLQVDFPRSHDLDLLRNLIPEGWSVGVTEVDLAALSEWAVESRYPGDWPDATPNDAKAALEHARIILDLVVADYATRGFRLA